MDNSNAIGILRDGLKQTAASRFDIFADRAFQGAAWQYVVLREAGLITKERVELLDGSLGCALTPAGVALSRQMGC